MDRICVAISAYNNDIELEKAVLSVVKQTMLPDGLIVFDNSDDAEIVKKNLSVFSRCSKLLNTAEYHKSEFNMGFASACEYMTKWAHNNNFDWVFILDQDGVMKDDCLEKLYRKRDKADALCSLVVAMHDKSTKLPTRNMLNIMGGLYAVPIKPHMDDMYVDSFGTCGTMFHRSVFDKVGYFDGENLFAGEDIDFGMRMHKKGIPLFWVMDSIVYHPDLRKKYSAIQQNKTSLFVQMSHFLPPFLGCFRENLPKYDQQRRFSSVSAIFKNLNFFQKTAALAWSTVAIFLAKLFRRDVQITKTLKCYFMLAIKKARIKDFAD